MAARHGHEPDRMPASSSMMKSIGGGDACEAQHTPAVAPKVASGSDPFALLGRSSRRGGGDCGCGDHRLGDGGDYRGGGRVRGADNPGHVLGGAVVLSTLRLLVGRAARKASGRPVTADKIERNLRLITWLLVTNLALSLVRKPETPP
jgi:hypothetical protein